MNQVFWINYPGVLNYIRSYGLAGCAVARYAGMHICVHALQYARTCASRSISFGND